MVCECEIEERHGTQSKSGTQRFATSTTLRDVDHASRRHGFSRRTVRLATAPAAVTLRDGYHPPRHTSDGAMEPRASRRLPGASRRLPCASRRLPCASRRLTQLPSASRRLLRASRRLPRASQRLPRASRRRQHASRRRQHASRRRQRFATLCHLSTGLWHPDSGLCCRSTELWLPDSGLCRLSAGL